MDMNNSFNESKLIIFIYSDMLKGVTLAKEYVKNLKYLGAPAIYIEGDIPNIELNNTIPQWIVCVKQDLSSCSKSIVADEIFFIYDEDTPIEQEQLSNYIEVKVYENSNIQDILTQVLRKSSLAKTASEIWKKGPPITGMGKVVEKIVKEDPFVTSVTSHKTDSSTKCIFDCDTSILCLCSVKGINTLVSYNYIYI